jgi:hypothetical protein
LAGGFNRYQLVLDLLGDAETLEQALEIDALLDRRLSPSVVRPVHR